MPTCLTSVATDTIKNIVQCLRPREHRLSTEEFCQVFLAPRFFDTYPQIASVRLTAHETSGDRLSFGGTPPPTASVP